MGQGPRGPNTRRRAEGASQLGQAVRRLRDEHRWTQAELADRAGVSQGEVSQLEQGRIRAIGPHRYKDFARAFGMSTTDFLLTAGVLAPEDLADGPPHPALDRLVAGLREHPVVLEQLDTLGRLPQGALLIADLVELTCLWVRSITRARESYLQLLRQQREEAS